MIISRLNKLNKSPFMIKWNISPNVSRFSYITPYSVDFNHKWTIRTMTDILHRCLFLLWLGALFVSTVLVDRYGQIHSEFFFLFVRFQLFMVRQKLNQTQQCFMKWNQQRTFHQKIFLPSTDMAQNITIIYLR